MLYKKLPEGEVLISRGNATRSALPKRFNVCVWNFQKCKGAQWARDFGELAAKTDLFLAQEVMFSPCAESALSAAPLYWTAAISFLTLRGHIPVGIAAGCVTRPEAVAFNASVREPLLKTPKMTMSAVYPLAHTRLLVINIHAINFTGLKAFEQNLQNAEKLLGKFDGPVLIAGDFNVWSTRRLNRLRELALKLQLEEVDFTPDLRTRYLRKTVDYIFVRGLHIRSAQVPDVRSSDHRPLLAELELL